MAPCGPLHLLAGSSWSNGAAASGVISGTLYARIYRLAASRSWNDATYIVVGSTTAVTDEKNKESGSSLVPSND